MDLGLKGKVAIVTGAGQGVGEGIALTLAKEGAKVVVNDFFQDRAEKVAISITAAGGEAIALQADVSNFESVKQMVTSAKEKFGRIDILINNAGVPAPPPEGDSPTALDNTFDKVDQSTWKRFIDVNIYGVMNCTRAVIDGMIAQKYGKIINIISDAGRIGEPRQAAYSASKAGVAGFSKALAKEMGKHCINVNCLSLGAVPHPGIDGRRIAMMEKLGMTEQQAKEAIQKVREGAIKLYPMGKGLGRFGTPTDVANAAAFFASDASVFISGQTLSISGGYTTVG
jgi:2-hydroxycyclohexanecarboxyl-CoA dehydrogenase